MNAVAKRRKGSGLTQAEFAQKCGISRQFLGLVEKGKTQPNVQAALQMAKFLGCTVEALFDPRYNENEPVDFTPIEELPLLPNTRVALGNIRGQWIAKSVDSADTLSVGFSACDGVVQAKHNKVKFLQKPEDVARNIIVSGCDPALNLIREHLITLESRLIVHTCGSEHSLDLFDKGMVHMAGFHFPSTDGKDNLDHLSGISEKENVAVFRFSSWELGWMLHPRVATEFKSIDDLTQPQIRLANREQGSGARVWLDEQLKLNSIPSTVVNGYDVEYTTHFGCAQAVRSGIADVALGPRAVAGIMGLEFVSAIEFPFDLILHKELIQQPTISRFFDALSTHRLQQQMKNLSGYNTVASGNRLL